MRVGAVKASGIGGCSRLQELLAERVTCCPSPPTLHRRRASSHRADDDALTAICREDVDGPRALGCHRARGVVEGGDGLSAIAVEIRQSTWP